MLNALPRNQVKEAKKLIQKMKQRRLRATTLQREEEKSLILHSHHWKKGQIESTKIISHIAKKGRKHP